MMLKNSIIVLAIMLSACSTTVPVAQKFPAAPPELLKQCEQLKKVATEGTVNITDLLKIVVENYQLYYECKNRVEGWQEWHKTNQELWDKLSPK